MLISPAFFLPDDQRNVYPPFDDLPGGDNPGNPTIPEDYVITRYDIAEWRNFAPSAFEDRMFIPLSRAWGDCTGLTDIPQDAFCHSLDRLCRHYRIKQKQLFCHGARIYLNGGIAGRQSVRRFHWRCIGNGRKGGDLGPYRTFDDGHGEREVVGLDKFPNDFVVQPLEEYWAVEPYPTPHANVDLLLVPPAPLWREGFGNLPNCSGGAIRLLHALRNVMAANPFHFAWGYRLVINIGPDARQSPIPGLPFECRLLAGGIAPANPDPVPCYQDLGRYSMVAGLPDEKLRTKLTDLLAVRAKQVGLQLEPSYWQAKRARLKAAFPQQLPEQQRVPAH